MVFETFWILRPFTNASKLSTSLSNVVKSVLKLPIAPEISGPLTTPEM